MRPQVPPAAALLLATLLIGASPAGPSPTSQSPADAQQRASRSQVGPVAAQLAAISETMEQMHELLAKQLETQTLDLLFKRTQLASAEVTRIDRTLRRTTQKRLALDKQRDDLELREQALDDLGDFDRQTGASAPSSEELERQRRDLEVSRDRVESRIRTLDAEIVELESRLDERLRDLETWEEMLDRRLAEM